MGLDGGEEGSPGLKRTELGREEGRQASSGLKWEETGLDGGEEGSPGLKQTELGREEGRQASSGLKWAESGRGR